MPDTVTTDFISFGGRKYPRGAVVTVPEESRSWLLSAGHITAGGTLPAGQGSGPDMTDAAAAAIAEHGLEAAVIAGSGSGGRITLPDVTAHLAMLETDDAADADDLDDDEEGAG